MLYQSLVLWASAPHFWISVGAPAAGWAAVLLTPGLRSVPVGGPAGLCGWALATLATFTGGRWHESVDAVSLHLVSYVSLLYFLHAYRRTPPQPLEGGALAFFSLLLCDIAHAALRQATSADKGRTSPVEWLIGVGGAGWGDGLVLLPTGTALVLAYAHWRARGGLSQRRAAAVRQATL